MLLSTISVIRAESRGGDGTDMRRRRARNAMKRCAAPSKGSLLAFLQNLARTFGGKVCLSNTV